MGKKILILGASSDIGIALIKGIHTKYEVVIAHYNSSFIELANLHKELGDKLQTVKADFSNESDTDEFIRYVKEKYAYVDHIVHLPAQRIIPRKFVKSVWGDMLLDINVQLGSVYKISQNFIPEMSKNKKGKLVFVLSSYTVITPKFMTPYTTIKYALLGLMKSLATEYADKNININAVSPSMIETKFLEDTPRLVIEQSAIENPMKRNACVCDIVPLISFLLSEEADYITGQNIVISGGSVI